jgi:L-rhamnose mutarotase
MARLCFTFEVYEGAEGEYKKRHDEIWPELVEAIEGSGLRNYSLFRRGVQVVGYVEGDDIDASFAKVGESDANRRWAEWFQDVIVNLTDGRGNLMIMQEVWHLD